ncbi:hypothetical protein KAFR_0D00240 [Kazachstania africana CBS 2517]|uniref:Uncharacterized protein n=1 Tax=Kazachstania africana (strain ATCC 22294 / BCRC 22015 / CBS 2517 / CECT 1963 / NBRC 1671 / NRRL Y-8276) TaxID=1071382 RepID=H2ATH0_KAZAF|nr:hypothetical protein KAFR_0D00240 [Kazachstania africana CBS 2517]CCF57670.1 hypothetical protein KAFR_0D00240 [Kazachstania africana CBS 2517]
MAETQHLQLPDVSPTVASFATPSKRGHRHKRSLAISGDFEFLKQAPSSVPPLPTYATSPNTYLKPAVLDPSMVKTPQHPGNPIGTTPSPRFFISEEPRFSSPIQGVPDAIINLDDALKTRPRSFKTHRRSESAPADLEITLDFPAQIKSKSNKPSFTIDEEEDVSDNEERPSVKLADGLLSPLRPSTPLFPDSKMEPGSKNTSPLKDHEGTNNNEKFNSLKIMKQKQRYRYYTKQLPVYGIDAVSDNTGVQSQRLKNQASTLSLTSSISITPASNSYTPSRHLVTPMTPDSFVDQQKQPESITGTLSKDRSASNRSIKFQEAISKRTLSPQRKNFQRLSNTNINTVRRNSSTGVYSKFNFKSKEYDMPYNDVETESKLTLVSKSDEASISTDLNLVENEVCGKKNELSKELLLGEPGDTVDLSSFSMAKLNSAKPSKTNLKPSISNDKNNVKLQKKDDLDDIAGGKDKASEVKADSAPTFGIKSKSKKKRKSRLSIFINLFTKDKK